MADTLEELFKGQESSGPLQTLPMPNIGRIDPEKAMDRRPSPSMPPVNTDDALQELISSIQRDYGLPMLNQYGQFQVGGPIGLSDVRNQFVQDPMAIAASYLGVGVTPVGDLMAVEDTARAMNRPLVSSINQLGAITDSPESRGAEIALNALGALPLIPAMGRLTKIEKFDPRFDPRKKEINRLLGLEVGVEDFDSPTVEEISIFDLEGRPFITSMSDRTAADGLLVSIDDVEFNTPIELLGGQDYMFYNPGQVWASGKTPATAIHTMAQDVKRLTGQNPLFLPWRMAPTGGDFAHMTSESMIAYASANMSPKQKRALNKAIKEFRTVGELKDGRRVGAGLGIKNWKGVDDPKSIDAVRDAPDRVVKELKNFLDVNFRGEGGLSIGQARLSVADPTQLTARDAGLQNIGIIDTSKPIITDSGHPSYPFGVPGGGIGRLKEDITSFQLLPDVVAERGIVDPRLPGQRDIRALQMKPYPGIINEDVLRALESS